MMKMNLSLRMAGQGLAALLTGAGLMALGAPRVAERVFPAGMKMKVSALLWRVANDPYAGLSDDEVTEVTGSLDITQEKTWGRLNRVLSPRIYDLLWAGCVRHAAGKGADMQELIRAVQWGNVRNPAAAYPGIFEEIRRRGTEERELTTERGKLLLKPYLEDAAPRMASLKEALRLIPKRELDGDAAMVFQCWRGERFPEVEALRQIVALPPDLLGGSLQKLAGQRWGKLKGEARRGLLEDMSGLPEGFRNRALVAIGSEWRDPSWEMELELMGAMTSYQDQRLVMQAWLAGDTNGSKAGELAEHISVSGEGGKRLEKARQYAEERQRVPGHGVEKSRYRDIE
jgi:hypothetical protein